MYDSFNFFDFYTFMIGRVPKLLNMTSIIQGTRVRTVVRQAKPFYWCKPSDYVLKMESEEHNPTTNENESDNKPEKDKNDPPGGVLIAAMFVAYSLVETFSKIPELEKVLFPILMLGGITIMFIKKTKNWNEEYKSKNEPKNPNSNPESVTDDDNNTSE